MATTTVPMTAEIEGMDTVLKNQQQRDYENDENNDQHLTEAEKSMRDEELSFYSNSTNDYGDDNIWGLLSGIGGNIYEWYVDVPLDHTMTRSLFWENDDFLQTMLDSNSNSCCCIMIQPTMLIKLEDMFFDRLFYDGIVRLYHLRFVQPLNSCFFSVQFMIGTISRCTDCSHPKSVRHFSHRHPKNCN